MVVGEYNSSFPFTQNFLHTRNIGLVHQALGDFDLALEYHTDALIIDRDIGDRGGEAKDLGSIGMIYYRKGNYRTSLKHLREARELLAQTGPPSDLETVENTIREIESLG